MLACAGALASRAPRPAPLRGRNGLVKIGFSDYRRRGRKPALTANTIERSPVMRTLLSKFCEEFDRSVDPLMEPLRRANEILAENSARAYARDVLPELQEIAHQLVTLTEKVAEQQAYVLIFGPLKSGKSTLMNAMSAAYVSEVTSLPAYPCMVYVSDSDQREFITTRHDGTQDVFHDPAALRLQVSRAHTDLAESLRQVEDQGEDFDPAVHFPEAIRRIDVRLPAGELARSGSVLVDTPGLYSRMKFGYDRMTREFRNSAACAIFVVKTENLFLEQVFEEFNDLLDLFNRIFLVVNIDSTKKDLRPDGTLVPSLESEDPLRVIEAFENLAMNAPLKAAADAGRLRIYPVDLLHAASRRLGGETVTGEPRAESTSEIGGSVGGNQADFEGFMSDLAEYLDSTDYLLAFLGDSMRCALGLLGELKSVCEHRAFTALGQELTKLEHEHTLCRQRIAALERLAVFPWNDALARLGAREEALADEPAGQALEELTPQITAAVHRWFKTDASLHALLETSIAPLIASCQAALAQEARESLHGRVEEDSAAHGLPEAVARDMATTGLSLVDSARRALEGLDPQSLVAGEIPGVDQDTLPVRRGLTDWLLLRSRARVRRALFGSEHRPDKILPRDVKARRLGDVGRKAIQNALGSTLRERLPDLLADVIERLHGDYAAAVGEALALRVGALRKELGETLKTTQQHLREFRKVLNRVSDLQASATMTCDAMHHLAEEYRQTDADLLFAPIESTPQAHPPAVLPDALELTDDEQLHSPVTEEAVCEEQAAELPDWTPPAAIEPEELPEPQGPAA